jgi:hypothetical protein
MPATKQVQWRIIWDFFDEINIPRVIFQTNSSISKSNKYLVGDKNPNVNDDINHNPYNNG